MIRGQLTIHTIGQDTTRKSLNHMSEISLPIEQARFFFHHSKLSTALIRFKDLIFYGNSFTSIGALIENVIFLNEP